MKKIAVIAISLLAVVGLLKVGSSFMQNSMQDSVQVSVLNSFKDTLPSWASDSINRLSSAGVIQGYSNGKFGPSDNLTRGQVVTLLYRMLTYKSVVTEPNSTQCAFYSDVKDTDYYYLPICTLVLNGGTTVLNNDPDVFDPNALVTRAEAAKLIDSMLGNTFLQAMSTSRGTEVVFQDVPKDNPYFNNIALVYTTGLMSGKSEGHFAPDGLLNRAEISVIMDRTLNLMETLNIKELAKELAKDDYLTECADLINSQTDLCSGYKNWAIDIQVLKQDTKTNKSDIEIDQMKLGPGNKCSISKAGEKFPEDIQSKFLSNIESGGGKNVQMLCKVTCSGWDSCPSEEQITNTCTGDSMSPSDCLQTCDGTCEDAPGQVGCSVCVQCDPEEDDYSDQIIEPPNNCGEMPFYDCSQCNGLPSYPTFQYENCLTSCENDYQNAMATYNQCLEQ